MPHAVLGTEIKDRQVTVEMLVKIEYLFQGCKLHQNKFKIVSLYSEGASFLSCLTQHCPLVVMEAGVESEEQQCGRYLVSGEPGTMSGVFGLGTTL